MVGGSLLSKEVVAPNNKKVIATMKVVGPLMPIKDHMKEEWSVEQQQQQQVQVLKLEDSSFFSLRVKGAWVKESASFSWKYRV